MGFGSGMGAPDTSIAFVFFKATDLSHLERSWYSLSRQDFTGVGEIVFLDNDTPYELADLWHVLLAPDMPVPIVFLSHKHGDPTRTHSWSVNRVCQCARYPLVCFLRSDYLLSFDALRSLRDEFYQRPVPTFVSGWCYQMAYDRQEQPYPSLELDTYPWRTEGPEIFVDRVPGYTFHETDQDAGVWLAPKAGMEAAGWMNEKLTSWGYQQSTFQRALRNTGTPCYTIPRHLFFHQPHGFVPRDFEQARREYAQYGGGV